MVKIPTVSNHQSLAQVGHQYSGVLNVGIAHSFKPQHLKSSTYILLPECNVPPAKVLDPVAPQELFSTLYVSSKQMSYTYLFAVCHSCTNPKLPLPYRNLNCKAKKFRDGVVFSRYSRDQFFAIHLSVFEKID